MNKFVIYLFALLFTTFSASAGEMPEIPAVGDMAKFEWPIKDRPTYYLELEILAIDAGKDQITLRQTTTTSFGGPPQVGESKVSISALPSKAQLMEVLRDCRGAGGVPEVITVPAGTFDTCKIAQVDGGLTNTSWLTTVPFASAKITQTGRDSKGYYYDTDLRLIEFRFGGAAGTAASNVGRAAWALPLALQATKKWQGR